MIDVAPELLEKIKASFDSKYEQSNVIKNLLKKVEDGKGTYAEANEYAIEVGQLLARAFQDNLSSSVLPEGKMYYNIAKRIIDPTMTNNYELVATVAQRVQQSLNKQANIGIKAIKPKLNESKVKGIIDKVSSDDYDKVSWVLDEPIQTFTQSVVDDAIKANAEFHYESGMKPKIIRYVAGDCCEWCQQVAGRYTYPDVPKDVYRRHQRCRCTVNYYPGDGKVQNVHTKRWNKIEVNEIEYMGKRTPQRVQLGDEKYTILTYKNDKYKNIYCQTYTKNSQKMCEYLHEEINTKNKYGKIDRIVVAKHSALKGIAAYNHVDNSFYICEELIDKKLFNEIVDSNYFAAKSLDDVLTHELKGHKKHWASVFSYKVKNSTMSLNSAKEQLEAQLREYVNHQTVIDPFYLLRTVSYNAFIQFKTQKLLNECIADATILIEKDIMKDNYLLDLIKGVTNYDDSAN